MSVYLSFCDEQIKGKDFAKHIRQTGLDTLLSCQSEGFFVVHSVSGSRWEVHRQLG